MATFTGTAGNDTFNGTDGAADLFRFTPANLSLNDTVTGGLGTVNDTLEFLAGGNISAANLAGVSGIEIVKLFGNNTIELTTNMFNTSRLGTITIQGSALNDTVFAYNNGSSSNSSSFVANLGNDVYVGGSGNDTIGINHNALTFQDIFIGGLGDDRINVTSAGTLAETALQNVFGFERVYLHASGNEITLSQGSVGSADGIFRVFGGNGNDSVYGSNLTSGFNFNAGDGTNYMSGGGGNDNAVGGSGVDTFYGNAGADTLSGNGGADFLFGGSGNNNLRGGEGDDSLFAGSGRTTFVGGAGADQIQTWSGDFFDNGNGFWDFIRYEARGEGGGTGDVITGDLGYIDDGDIKFQFKLGGAGFNTLGNNFDKVFFDNGGSVPGSGGPADGADLVLFNNGGAGLTSTSAVDTYFFDRYYVADNIGAFLMNYDNTTGVATLYYDNDAYSTGGVEILAQVEGMSAADFALLGNDFSYFV